MVSQPHCGSLMRETATFEASLSRLLQIFRRRLLGDYLIRILLFLKPTILVVGKNFTQLKEVLKKLLKTIREF